MWAPRRFILIKVVLIAALSTALGGLTRAVQANEDPKPIRLGADDYTLVRSPGQTVTPPSCAKNLLPAFAAKYFPMKVLVWIAIDRITTDHTDTMKSLIGHILQIDADEIKDEEVSAFLPSVIQFLYAEFSQMKQFEALKEGAWKHDPKAVDAELDQTKLGFDVYPMPRRQRLAAIELVRNPPRSRRDPKADPEAQAQDELDELIRQTAKNPNAKAAFDPQDKPTEDQIHLAEAAVEIFYLRNRPGTLWVDKGTRGNKFPMMFLSRDRIENLPYGTTLWHKDGTKITWEKGAIPFDESLPPYVITEYGLNGSQAFLPFDGNEKGSDEPYNLGNALTLAYAADVIYDIRGDAGTQWFEANELGNKFPMLLLTREKIESLHQGTRIWDLDGNTYKLGYDSIPFDETLKPDVLTRFGINGAGVEPDADSSTD